MFTQVDLERARVAISVVRQALAISVPRDGESTRLVPGDPVEKETLTLSLFLLATCCDPEDLAHELGRFDAALTGLLGDLLLAGVDWDQCDWAG